MNGKDIKNTISPIIEIYNVGNGQFQARSKLDPNQTANIMFNLAIVMIRQDEKNKTLKESNVINPHTGKPVLKEIQKN